jgi:hypothetical protein
MHPCKNHGVEYYSTRLTAASQLVPLHDAWQHITRDWATVSQAWSPALLLAQLCRGTNNRDRLLKFQ